MFSNFLKRTLRVDLYNSYSYCSMNFIMQNSIAMGNKIQVAQSALSFRMHRL
jgi:hypothetical protein